MGASSSTSSPANDDDADLAAVTARCIISRTPNLDEPPLLAVPLPLELLTDAALLPVPEEVTVPSKKTMITIIKTIMTMIMIIIMMMVIKSKVGAS